MTDGNDVPMSFALDETYSGIHAPSTLKHIIVLGWVLLGVAALSAGLERCYKWPKAAFIFLTLVALMWLMTTNALWLYEPYLAARR